MKFIFKLVIYCCLLLTTMYGYTLSSDTGSKYQISGGNSGGTPTDTGTKKDDGNNEENDEEEANDTENDEENEGNETNKPVSKEFEWGKYRCYHVGVRDLRIHNGDKIRVGDLFTFLKPRPYPYGKVKWKNKDFLKKGNYEIEGDSATFIIEGVEYEISPFDQTHGVKFNIVYTENGRIFCEANKL